MEAMTTKVGVINFQPASDPTTKKGFGLAGSIARKYIHINRSTVENP
jgi:hypothetical protein